MSEKRPALYANKPGPSTKRDPEHDISFEARAYPCASKETLQLLAICRATIKRFLDSDFGKSKGGSDTNAVIYK